MSPQVDKRQVMKRAKAKAAATQKYIPIKEIRDDCVILPDGTLRAVILVSSVNFDLKSEEEQNATIAGYVQFLNTLEFPIQIVIQSRKMNIDEYLARLRQKEKEQTNELLRAQIADYIEYISELIKLSDIMTKRFYLVIPYDPIHSRPKGFFTRLQEVLWPRARIILSQKKFRERRVELAKRVDMAMGALASMGLHSVRLDTQSLIELYYNTYNPSLFDTQELVDIGKVNVESS